MGGLALGHLGCQGAISKHPGRAPGVTRCGLFHRPQALDGPVDINGNCRCQFGDQISTQFLLVTLWVAKAPWGAKTARVL